jgi:xanthosine utilization system XapX-like protein
MSNSVYQINKGINQSIQFKGLKAQYIWYLGGGVIVLMILFAILYIAGVPSFMCIAIIGISGTLWVLKIYKMSHKYGEYGMMKALAKRQVPKAVKCRSRKVFMMKK